jgi:hypothetical protein
MSEGKRAVQRRATFDTARFRRDGLPQMDLRGRCPETQTEISFASGITGGSPALPLLEGDGRPHA